MKQISHKEFNVAFKDGNLKRNGRIISDDKLIQEILTKYKTFNYDKATEIIEEWKNLASNETEFDINEYIREKVIASGIADNFVIIKHTFTNDAKPILHYKSNNILKIIGALPLMEKSLVQMFREFEPNKFKDLREVLSEVLNPKRPISVSDETIAEHILNVTQIHYGVDRTIEVDRQIKPVTLNTKEMAYNYIDYNYKENPILNPNLKDFLNRVSNHELLCAILYQALNGIKLPYVVYMFGSGGEGKSAFLGMLSNLMKSFASFEAEGLHNYYHMYSKALLILEENTDTFLLQNKAIKEITGSALVSCQAKNQTSFTASIDGLFVVNSNTKPKIIGQEFEYRRLRYFEVDKPNLASGRIGFEEYKTLLGSTPDDFISYCKQCFEKHNRNGLIDPNSNMTQQIATLIDSQTKYHFEKMIKLMNLEFNTKLSISYMDFYDVFEKKLIKINQKDKYFTENFKLYLKLNYGVTYTSSEFKGIGIE